MIQAVKYNKVSLAEYKGNEDSLTSSVFERLAYLPSRMIFRILFSSLNIEWEVNQKDWVMRSMEFWPHWDGTGTSNPNFVEPDIFIRGRRYDIIIEAKRYDRNQQDQNQWKNELIAYQNEYEEDQKEVIFIALGGLRVKETEEVTILGNTYPIYKCTWTHLLRQVKSTLNKVRHRETSESQQSQMRILEDIIISCSLYGFFAADPFEWFSTDFSISTHAINTLVDGKNHPKRFF